MFVFTSIISNYEDENVDSLLKYAYNTEENGGPKLEQHFCSVCASGKSLLLCGVSLI